MEIWFLIVAGLALLVLGGELLVRGSVQLATRLGISPLIIGLTLVGFGTSMPELVTSVRAGLVGAPGVAYGNIVGSNIANILLIGGISAIITPIIVSQDALRRDVLIMLGAAIVFTVAALWLPMGRVVGLALVFGLAAYIVYTIQITRRSSHIDNGRLAPGGAIEDKASALTLTDPDVVADDNNRIVLPIVLAVIGLVLVILGGNFLVSGAVKLARDFGLSESIIGLTIVAIGTSLPELVTSVVAAMKRQGEIAFGNIVGSNIYNILGIGGTTALIAPSEVPEQIAHFDAPIMVLVSVVFLIFAKTGLRIGRIEGAFLTVGYLSYLWWLWQ